MLKIFYVETRQCDHKNKHTLTRLMEIGDVLLFFETCQCVLWHVALTRLYRERFLFLHVALGIGAASFWSAAEKDIAESPTRSGTPKRRN